MRRSALAATLVAGVLILGGAAYLSTRLRAAATAGQARPPAPPAPRLPSHPALLTPSDPAVRDGLETVDRLRRIRSLRTVPMGGAGDREYAESLDRVRDASPRLLHFLEEVALRRGEHASLRVDLVNVVAAHRDEETRKFLSSLVIDPAEDAAVRIAALEPLMKYRDPATFEVLKSAWRDPAPFEGRYHLCRAFGENGDARGLPLLREALAAGRPLDVRCHAALGLGGFADDPAVRGDLKRLALADPEPAVRQNAVGSLCRSADAEVDGFLRDLAGPGTADAEMRRAAQAFLKQRSKGP